jgi:hypothetical protein
MTKREQEKTVKRLIAGAGFVMFGVRVVWPAVRESRWFTALPKPSDAIAAIHAGIQRCIMRTRLWLHKRIGANGGGS